MTSAPMAATAAGPQARTAPKPIERSLFARSPQGQLSEDKLQEILDRPLELDLPARVGVLPVVAAEDWRGPGPSYEMAPAALSVFVKKLPSDDAFTLVSEMIPIPSGALGMEALREAAARYKLRYLVLYREHVVRSKRTNAWAVGYSTILGALFLPGATLEVDGYVEASLFDVKTGLLMFTVRRRVTARQKSNVWHNSYKLGQLQRRLARKAGAELAKDLRASLFHYRAAVEVENQRKVARARSSASPPTAAAAQGASPFPTATHLSGVRAQPSPTKP
ncbi:MAG: hypothetical protein KJO07_24620 [Deltaproteobacteria bacterium]|nr:hypothetical protein [Deltaproteobacteria bacterium]